MCGIAGIISYQETSAEQDKISAVLPMLAHRGPDIQQVKIQDAVAFAHARLSIIDTSAASNQPFSDEKAKLLIVFNGEIFNYKELRRQLENEGETFHTNGDVEVLLKLYKLKKENCLQAIRGFFAFAIYDASENTVFIARDRFGVKPMYYSETSSGFYFSSELRPLQFLLNSKKLNHKSLTTYFQLNYLAGEESILDGIKRLQPGECITIKNKSAEFRKYYSLQQTKTRIDEPAKKLRSLLEQAVADRLVADVEVGSFLSGGIDSTIITAIAAQQNANMHSFSIGFKDNPYYDESKLAESTAKKLNTRHHTFLLSNDDLLNEFDNFLDAIDEPFADSSALNVYILSKQTKKQVRVVLSGDGADELFAGYNKHRAEWLIRNKKGFRTIAALLAPFASLFPQSRNSFIGNKVRQLKKFNDTASLSLQERYWKLASISGAKEVKQLLLKGENNSALVDFYTQHISEDFNSFLLADVNMLLPFDMLTKVDTMSMAHGLEVRNPFLDHRLVEFAFSLDVSHKINSSGQKLILKESCADLIPGEILNRPKHGFEVPIQQWFSNELRSRIENDWLNEAFIKEQQLFSIDAIRSLKKQLFCSSPGDAAAKVWAIIIFNHWYKKHIA